MAYERSSENEVLYINVFGSIIELLKEKVSLRGLSSLKWCQGPNPGGDQGCAGDILAAGSIFIMLQLLAIFALAPDASLSGQKKSRPLAGFEGRPVRISKIMSMLNFSISDHPSGTHRISQTDMHTNPFIPVQIFSHALSF